RPSPQIGIRVSCNGEKIAFHRRLANAVSRHPRAHKCVRCDLVRHRYIAAQIQRKSPDIAGIAFVEVLDVRHHDCCTLTGEQSKGYIYRNRRRLIPQQRDVWPKAPSSMEMRCFLFKSAGWVCLQALESM